MLWLYDGGGSAADGGGADGGGADEDPGGDGGADEDPGGDGGGDHDDNNDSNSILECPFSVGQPLAEVRPIIPVGPG